MFRCPSLQSTSDVSQFAVNIFKLLGYSLRAFPQIEKQVLKKVGKTPLFLKLGFFKQWLCRSSLLYYPLKMLSKSVVKARFL